MCSSEIYRCPQTPPAAWTETSTKIYDAVTLPRMLSKQSSETRRSSSYGGMVHNLVQL
jgi:hypothetical protein